MKDLIANFYELWQGAHLGNFSNLMFDNDLYFSIAIWSIAVALVLTFTYYYIIDRPSTAKLAIWLLLLLIGGIISGIIAFVSANNDLTEVFASVSEEVPAGFTSDMMMLACINAMWTIILMALISFLIKWKSPNSSFVPF